MIDACKICIEQYDKKKKENKISKIYEEVLKLRDEAEKNYKSDYFETEYACYTKCLHIIGNYLVD